MLTPPPTFGTSRGVLDLNSSSQNLIAAATVENSPLWKRTLFFALIVETQLSSCTVQSQPSTPWSNFNFSTPWSDPNLSTPWSDLNFSTPWLDLNWTFFQNLPNSQPISSGHDVSHTPASFPVWGLLWQWWLLYPLRASVNCTQWYAPEFFTQIVQSPTKQNDKL